MGYIVLLNAQCAMSFLTRLADGFRRKISLSVRHIFETNPILLVLSRSKLKPRPNRLPPWPLIITHACYYPACEVSTSPNTAVGRPLRNLYQEFREDLASKYLQ